MPWAGLLWYHDADYWTLFANRLPGAVGGLIA